MNNDERRKAILEGSYNTPADIVTNSPDDEEAEAIAEDSDDEEAEAE